MYICLLLPGDMNICLFKRALSLIWRGIDTNFLTEYILESILLSGRLTVASLTNVTDFSFDPEVLKCDIPVLANFWAAWSVPAQQLQPQLEQLAARHAEQVKVVNVEIEDNPTVTSAYNILNLPTMVLFKNGLELVRLTGPQDQDSVLAAIQPYFDQ